MRKKVISLILGIAVAATFSVPTTAFAEQNVSAAGTEASTEAIDVELVDSDTLSDDVIGEVYTYTADEEELAESVEWSVKDAASADNNEYYGNHLTGTKAKIYNKLTDVSADNCTVSVEFPMDDDEELDDAFKKNQPIVLEAMTAFMFDHPEKLYFNVLNQVLFKYCTAWSDGKIVLQIHASYDVSDYYSEALDEQAEAKIDTIIAEVDGEDAYEQVKDIHDWLAINGSYDRDSLEYSDYSERSYYAHGPLGMLLSGTGVCESYAKIFKICCNRLNIPCVCVSGSGHMWNYVQMEDDEWYMVDCTWDDTDDSDDVIYKYFLVANNPYVDDSHTPNSRLAYPVTSLDNYVYDTEGHHYGEYVVTKKATCTVTGVKTATCTDEGCTATRTKTIPIDPNNHTKIVTVKGYAATALKTGKTNGTKCSACNTVIKKQTTIAKLTPKIKLSATSKKIKKSKYFYLTVSSLVKGDYVSSVKSSKTSIVTVKKAATNKYKITAKRKAGTAYVTVRLKSGKTAKCKVIVK